jgi:hypothetical protein
MSGFVKVLLVAVVGVLLGTWGAALMTLPPATADPQYKGVVLSAASDRILRESCFDCHSNETKYLWYDYVPGATQLVAWDVIKGRKELNFSMWDQMPDTRRARKLKETREQIESGEMPPWYYTLLLTGAKLTPQAKQRVLSDLAAAGAAGGKEGSREGKERGGAKEHEESKRAEKKH